jgi:U3 small nucleolar RNA-associated protein 21
VAPHTLKLPSATSLSFSTTRSRDWDDVLSTHAGVRAAHTWSARDRRMGSKPFSTEKAEATACCVSACGNFGLVGDAQGIVRAFNMQSGMLRRTYAATSPLGMQKGKKPAAKRGSGSPVTGVVSDSLNSLVAVSTLDGQLSVYDFHTAELLDVLKLDSPIASLALDRTTTLLATTHDDLTLRLIDLSTRRIVRQFAAFRARILDLTFSPDGRWLIVSSLDGVVRTYDVPSARLIDAFRPRRVATSVSFSPSSDFLATTHVGELGVYLWANRAQFSATAVRGMEEDEVWEAEAEGPVALPDMRGEDEDGEDDGPTELAEDGEGDAIRRVYTSPPQMEGAQEGALVTLTTMPRTRWMTLLNLDTIKRRNKPTEAPKKPERAPFFLPQLAGTELAFDAQKPAQAGGKEEKTGLPSRPAFGQEGLDFESDFVRRLRSAQESGDCELRRLSCHVLHASDVFFRRRAFLPVPPHAVATSARC